MILDYLLKLSAAQQVTADAVTTNDIDLGNVTPKRAIFDGEPMGILFIITAKGTTTGSFKLQAVQSATATLSSGTQILGEIDLAAADCVVGAMFWVAISAGIPPLRYIGGNYDITGTVDCTFDAYLLPRRLAALKPRNYAKGYVVEN